MNEVILTARAVLGAGYQIIFLEIRINFGRKSKHDLSDKNLLVQNSLYQLLSLVCQVTSVTASFCSFFVQAMTILYTWNRRKDVSGKFKDMKNFFCIFLSDLILLVNDQISTNLFSSSLVTM